ncbi:hypothetical protein WISP_02518 [Willisornis vidua]|uniref:Uncharacterized protein n=1 Tax=Willisornis vidua TaxID=1566151 RepID=A0ABQ9DX00_9PASS|nr:hypothetical protein WISP_02518 [Willisornis vidua]
MFHMRAQSDYEDKEDKTCGQIITVINYEMALPGLISDMAVTSSKLSFDSVVCQKGAKSGVKEEDLLKVAQEEVEREPYYGQKRLVEEECKAGTWQTESSRSRIGPILIIRASLFYCQRWHTSLQRRTLLMMPEIHMNSADMKKTILMNTSMLNMMHTDITSVAGVCGVLLIMMLKCSGRDQSLIVRQEKRVSWGKPERVPNHGPGFSVRVDAAKRNNLHYSIGPELHRNS